MMTTWRNIWKCSAQCPQSFLNVVLGHSYSLIEMFCAETHSHVVDNSTDLTDVQMPSSGFQTCTKRTLKTL